MLVARAGLRDRLHVHVQIDRVCNLVELIFEEDLKVVRGARDGGREVLSSHDAVLRAGQRWQGTARERGVWQRGAIERDGDAVDAGDVRLPDHEVGAVVVVGDAGARLRHATDRNVELVPAFVASLAICIDGLNQKISRLPHRRRAQAVARQAAVLRARLRPFAGIVLVLVLAIAIIGGLSHTHNYCIRLLELRERNGFEGLLFPQHAIDAFNGEILFCSSTYRLHGSAQHRVGFTVNFSYDRRHAAAAAAAATAAAAADATPRSPRSTRSPSAVAERE